MSKSKNLFDYLESVKDLSFYDLDLTDLDLLLLAELSYIELEGLVSPDFKVSQALRLDDLAPHFSQAQPTASMGKQDLQLLEAMAQSLRFRSCKVLAFVNHIIPEKNLQFSATTYRIKPDYHVLAFRGTDDSIIGWKEDLLLFYQEQLPSQKPALAYLKQALQALTGQMYLTGHSKGGHLAIAAASQLSLEEETRIQLICSFDAPGHRPHQLAGPTYQALQGKIKRFLPQGSLVSQVLPLEEPYQIIACKALTSFAQHNPYLWQVKDREFQLVSQVTRDSLELKATLNDWLTQTSPRDIQTLVQLAFDLLLDAEIVTTTSLFDNSFLSKSKEIIRNFCRLTKAEKHLLWRLSSLLVSLRIRHFYRGITHRWRKKD